MEDPTFASGGIVAFDEGGVTAANVKKPLPKTWEEVREQAMLGSEESIEDLEKDLARQDEFERRLQIGRYAPSSKLKETEAERKRKAQQEAEGELDELDRAKFFSDIAEIGSEAGTRETKAPTFLTALSKAKARQLERREKKIERKRTAEDAYNASRIAMAEAEEARAEGNLTNLAWLGRSRTLRLQCSKKEFVKWISQILTIPKKLNAFVTWRRHLARLVASLPVFRIGCLGFIPKPTKKF